jgi:hypothetical protein
MLFTCVNAKSNDYWLYSYDLLHRDEYPLPKDTMLKKLSSGRLFKNKINDCLAFSIFCPDIEPLLSIINR